jgi:hypothetical protein
MLIGRRKPHGVRPMTFVARIPSTSNKWWQPTAPQLLLSGALLLGGYPRVALWLLTRDPAAPYASRFRFPGRGTAGWVVGLTAGAALGTIAASRGIAAILRSEVPRTSEAPVAEPVEVPTT